MFQTKIFLIFVGLSILGCIDSAPNCPETCTCNPKKKSVDCHKKGFTDVPKDIPNYVVKLLLGFNDFETLKNDSFKTLVHLEENDLRNSKIETIQSATFQGLSSLKRLYLNNNELKTLPITLLDSLTHIQFIYLGHNKFVQIPPIQSQSVQRITLDSNLITNATIPKSFSKCKALNAFVLTDNPISTIKSGDFAALKDTPIQSLFLKQMLLKTISKDAFAPVIATLKSLSLDDNLQLGNAGVKSALLGFVESKTLIQLGLTNVNLAGNLAADLFAGLVNTPVTILILSNNPLMGIDPNAFKNLRALNKLFIESCNKFESIATNQFSPLTKLLELHLGKNVNLKTISPNAFDGLSQLDQLYLQQNALNELKAGSLSGMVVLKVLHLQKQNPSLEKIAPGAINLPELVLLDLSSNKISLKSGESPFSDLPKLARLNLAGNSIPTLYKTNFNGLLNLAILNMSNNNIKVWEEGTFQSCSGTLVSLDLAQNKISSISGGHGNNSLAPLLSGDTLRFLNLTGNPFSCTCEDIAWFVKWMKETKVILTGKETYKCVSPQRLAGTKLLDFDYITCLNRSTPATPTTKPTTTSTKPTTTLTKPTTTSTKPTTTSTKPTTTSMKTTSMTTKSTSTTPTTPTFTTSGPIVPHQSKTIVISSVCAVLSVLLAIVFAYVCYRRIRHWRYERREDQHELMDLADRPPLFCCPIPLLPSGGRSCDTVVASGEDVDEERLLDPASL